MSKTCPALAALLLGCAPLGAQEAWDPSFRLGLGLTGGSRSSQLGSDTHGTFALEGAYPLAAGGALVFDAGYRAIPKDATRRVSEDGSSTTFQESWSRAAFASVQGRYSGFQGRLEGAYAQAGLRYTVQSTAADRWILPGTVKARTGVSTRLTVPAAAALAPVLGAGVRFTDKLSLDASLSLMRGRNVDGECRNTVVLDLALGVHL